MAHGFSLRLHVSLFFLPYDISSYLLKHRTPVGQAIGLILHTSYSPESRAGLLMTGIMNAISSGLLIFASLVELMAEDFLSDESWKVSRLFSLVLTTMLIDVDT